MRCSMPESRSFQSPGLRTNRVELTFGLLAGAGACAEMKVAASVRQESRISKKNERSITFRRVYQNHSGEESEDSELRLGKVLC